MVVASTVVGAYMVEIAQAISGSGRLTAIRLAAQQVCYIVMGPTAGYLGSIAFGWTAVACGGVSFLLVPAAIFFFTSRARESIRANCSSMRGNNWSRFPRPERCGRLQG